MGKHEANTPKDIANRIKAKGLGKLRWYCQLCQKQCRDENGFKCHQTSEGHLRQMELFGESADTVVDDFSVEFETSFLEHFRIAHPSSRVSAKVVYNEYINDKHHVHMNATKWLTLTEFVKYLGREGKCKVEETPKGWFITLIQPDVFKDLDDARRIKRSAHEKEEEVRHMEALADQVERARKVAKAEEDTTPGATALLRDESEGPIKLALGRATATAGARNHHAASSSAAALTLPSAAAAPAAARAAPVFSAEDEDEPGSSAASRSAGHASSSAPSKPLSKLDALMQRDMAAKKDAAARAAQTLAGHDRMEGKAAVGAAVGTSRLDHWLVPGIVVKVMSKELKQHGFYKQKGVVDRLASRYVGEIAMLDGGDVIRVDQAQLETVIPSPGGAVLVVNGQHRGCKGTLLAIETAKFQAQVRLEDGAHKGADLWLEYEDVCKLATQ